MKTYKVVVTLEFEPQATELNRIKDAISSLIKPFTIYQNDPEDGHFRGFDFEPVSSNILIRELNQAELDTKGPLPFGGGV